MAIDLPPGVADDKTIKGLTRLLRRVHPDQVRDGQIDSSVFREREAGRGLSVTVWESPADLDDVVRRHEHFGVVCFTAESLRAIGVAIVRYPLVGNLNHCEVFPKLTGSSRNSMKGKCQWAYYPDWVLLEHRQALATF